MLHVAQGGASDTAYGRSGMFQQQFQQPSCSAMIAPPELMCSCHQEVSPAALPSIITASLVSDLESSQQEGRACDRHWSSGCRWQSS